MSCGIDISEKDLCCLLEDCILDKIKEELDKRPDNFVDNFYIDRVRDALVVHLKLGQEYWVTRADLEGWLQIQQEDKHIISFDIVGDNLEIERSDGVKFSVNKDALTTWLNIQAGGVASGSLIEVNGTWYIRLNNKDGSIIDIDVSALLGDKFIVDGELHKVASTDPNNGLDFNYFLRFHRNDSTNFDVDITEIASDLRSSIVKELSKIDAYRIVDVVSGYTLTDADFDGRTFIKVSGQAGHGSVLNLTAPSANDADYVGRVITVFNGGDSELTLLGGTISPPDISPLRRSGSTVALLYTGGGAFVAMGELP